MEGLIYLDDRQILYALQQIKRFNPIPVTPEQVGIAPSALKVLQNKKLILALPKIGGYKITEKGFTWIRERENSR